MDVLPMLDGPGRLSSFCITERNRLRREAPEIDATLMRFLMTLPPETFDTDPRLYAQYGAGFGYFERSNRGTVAASPDFMPNVTLHAFNAFVAIQPYKSAERNLETKLYVAVCDALRSSHNLPHPEISQTAIDHGVAFIGGYRIVSEYK